VIEYRDPSLLQKPLVYRPTARPQRGKATRPSGDHEVIDPQPVHQFQAQHVEAEFFYRPVPLGFRLRRLAYRLRWTLTYAVVLAGAGIAPFAIDWFTAIPDGTQRNLIVALVLATFACAVAIALGRVLR